MLRLYYTQQVGTLFDRGIDCVMAAAVKLVLCDGVVNLGENYVTFHLLGS